MIFGKRDFLNYKKDQTLSHRLQPIHVASESFQQKDLRNPLKKF